MSRNTRACHCGALFAGYTDFCQKCRKINSQKVRDKRIKSGEEKRPTRLKEYLFRVHGKKCVLCGNKGTHRKIPLMLQLDHADGNSDNNKPSNLRLLCPNCHSQTETYAGGNKAKLKNTERCVSARLYYHNKK